MKKGGGNIQFVLSEGTGTMKLLIKRLLQEEKGQDLTEYALLLVLLSLAAVAFLDDLATTINNVFSNGAGSMTPTCCD